MPDYLTRPVFDFPVDWADRPSAAWSYDLRPAQVGFGRERFAPLQSHVVHGFDLSVGLESHPDTADFDAFFAALLGRVRGFWLPGPIDLAQIVAGVSTTQFDIATQGLTDTWEDHPAQHVILSRADQADQYASITAVTDNGDGTERVTVSPALDPAVDETWLCRRLHYVRLADATEQGEFTSEGTMNRQLRVIELPLEYAAAELGTQPIYLYHFWVDAAGLQIDWRFTSYFETVTSGGQDFTAAGIQHGALSRSLRMDQQTVQIEGWRDDIEPLRLLFPLKLWLPLWVEIRETTLPAPDTTKVLFTGRVLRAPAKGKVCQADCSGLLTALGSQVPTFSYGQRCGYRVYQADTCRADQAAVEEDVTIDTINGAEVTVTGAGLTGLAADHFAEGWIEVGSGFTFEARSILESTAEAGGEVTLTLIAPLTHAAVTDSALAVPGCDGAPETCQNKFAPVGGGANLPGNFDNFGGHVIPRKNLSVIAIEVDPGSGGKK